MKKNLSLFCLSLIIFIFSCHKKDNTGPSGTLSVSRTAIRLDTAKGSSDTFTVRSTFYWTATLSSGAASWLQLDKTNGTNGDSVLKVTVLSNNGSNNAQSATITLSAVNNAQIHPVIITVTQKPYSFNLIWQRPLGGADYEVANAGVKTPDGGSIMTGYTYSVDGDVVGNHGAYDVWVVKLDGSGNKQWAKTFGGTDSDYGSSIVATSDGGYAVAGYTFSVDGDVVGNHGGYDVWVLKLDGSGNLQWAKTFGGTSDEQASSIVSTTDGGYAVAGFTTSSDGDVTGYKSGYDLWVVKLDGSGNKQWTKTFGGTSDDQAFSLVSTTDGGYAVAGYTGSTDGDVVGNHGGFDLWVVKLDGSGNKQWAKTFGGTSDDFASSIIVTPNGGYAIAGYANSIDGDVTGNHGNNDFWALKLDGSGNKQWAKSYGGTGDDEAYSIVTTADGGYAMAGYNSSTDGDVTSNYGNLDTWVVKLDASGNKQWVKSYGGSGSDYANSIIVTPDGGYTVLGNTASNDMNVAGNHGSYDFWALKMVVY